MQVVGDGTARGGALVRVVAEHAGEFGVAAGAFGELGDGGHRDAGEEALQYGVPPVVRGEVLGGVGADGGGDEPGVVRAQRVLDEGQRFGSRDEVGQGREDGAAFGGGALFVEAGEGGGVGAGRVQEDDAGAVGVLATATAPGFGEPQLP